MKHLKKINENFIKRAVNAVGKAFNPDPITLQSGLLDDTEKKYTEKQLFDLTEESFKLGYAQGDVYRAKNIGNNAILNDHKEWWNDMMKKFSLLKSR